jgi:phosphoglycerate dehydrogenase-like enzyme
MKQQPTVALLLTAVTRQRVLAPEAEQNLAAFARVVAPPGATLTPADLPGLLAGARACLTGWGTPPLSDALLAAHPDLRLIAHTAGSIRRLVSRAALERGVQVSHTAAVIAEAVAEFVIAQMLLCLRYPHDLDRAMKDGTPWNTVKEHGITGRLLGSQTVGVIGTGRVGRAVIQLLRAYGCRILAYDPLLSEADAATLGVEARALDDLCAAADIVTLHAPVLPETHGMIGAAQLARLRDGTIFINDARAVLVDNTALARELSSGRIVAALDVFDPEPLPANSPLRQLPNVILAPHVAGSTRESNLRQGQAMVEELARFVTGQPLRYAIAPDQYDVLA